MIKGFPKSRQQTANSVARTALHGSWFLQGQAHDAKQFYYLSFNVTAPQSEDEERWDLRTPGWRIYGSTVVTCNYVLDGVNPSQHSQVAS